MIAELSNASIRVSLTLPYHHLKSVQKGIIVTVSYSSVNVKAAARRTAWKPLWSRSVSKNDLTTRLSIFFSIPLTGIDVNQSILPGHWSYVINITILPRQKPSKGHSHAEAACAVLNAKPAMRKAYKRHMRVARTLPSPHGVPLDALMRDNATSFRSIPFLFTPRASGETIPRFEGQEKNRRRSGVCKKGDSRP